MKAQCYRDGISYFRQNAAILKNIDLTIDHFRYCSVCLLLDKLVKERNVGGGQSLIISLSFFFPVEICHTEKKKGH